MTLGSLFRSKRRSLGLSLEQASELIFERTGVRIRWQYIGTIERDEVQTPGDEFLRPMAEALGIPWLEVRQQQGWVVGENHRSVEEEGGVAYDVVQVRRVDVAREGECFVPVLREWLGGRTEDQCFTLDAKDDLPGVPRGFRVLFEKLNGELPTEGEIVAIEDERGWWMTVWTSELDREPSGRKLRAWEP